MWPKFRMSSGSTVRVNPENISFIVDDGPDQCVVHFGPDRHLVIGEHIDEVARNCEGALLDARSRR